MKDIEALRVRQQQEAIISLRPKGKKKWPGVWPDLELPEQSHRCGTSQRSRETAAQEGGAENSLAPLLPPSLEGVVSFECRAELRRTLNRSRRQAKELKPAYSPSMSYKSSVIQPSFRPFLRKQTLGQFIGGKISLRLRAALRAQYPLPLYSAFKNDPASGSLQGSAGSSVLYLGFFSSPWPQASGFLEQSQPVLLYSFMPWEEKQLAE